MKTISMRAWANKRAEIEELAQNRIAQLGNSEYKVEVFEEDIQEELLVLCRGHAEYLCGGSEANPFFLWNKNHTAWTVEWVEAGEQVYATWRGWV